MIRVRCWLAGCLPLMDYLMHICVAIQRTVFQRELREGGALGKASKSVSLSFALSFTPPLAVFTHILSPVCCCRSRVL